MSSNQMQLGQAKEGGSVGPPKEGSPVGPAGLDMGDYGFW
jgi:hypothetical protein